MFHMKSSNANGIHPMEYGINNLVNGKVSSPGMAKGMKCFATLLLLNYLALTMQLEKRNSFLS